MVQNCDFNRTAAKTERHLNARGLRSARGESKGEYGSVTLWETKEDAEAAAERLRANFMEHHADKVASPPEAHTAEVYEPN